MGRVTQGYVPKSLCSCSLWYHNVPCPPSFELRGVQTTVPVHILLRTPNFSQWAHGLYAAGLLYSQLHQIIAVTLGRSGI